jgi:AraC-like DNA-binding protein
VSAVISEKLNMLWVDLKVEDSEGGPDSVLSDYFDIKVCGRDSRIAQQFESAKPDVVCFDFDYPDRAGLRMVEEMKRLIPSAPMLVATVQHSEELAVWAFRSRMTDFLVKPFNEDELMRCYGVLLDITMAKRGQVSRSMSQSESILPPSVVSGSAHRATNLEPALYFVEQHYREKIRAGDVATLCGMSSFRFSRIFKEVYGVAFRDYVVRYRLREAHRMLSDGHASVTEAACANGFNDVGYFSRMFKRHFNVSPSTLCNVEVANAEAPMVAEDSPTVILQLPVH